MDAKEFLLTVRKECKKHNFCTLCPLNKILCDTLEGYSKMTNRDITSVLKTVGKIACKMTYAEDFFEKHPEASKEEDGTPKVCRELVYRAENPACGGDGECYRCWNEPFPEKEDK